MNPQPLYQGQIENVFDESIEILQVRTIDTQSQVGRRHLVCLNRSTDGGTHWDDVGSMCPDDARGLTHHLLNAADRAEAEEEQTRAGITGIRRLPTIVICGQRFFIDERLRQLRNVEDPNHWFDIDMR